MEQYFVNKVIEKNNFIIDDPETYRHVAKVCVIKKVM